MVAGGNLPGVVGRRYPALSLIMLSDVSVVIIPWENQVGGIDFFKGKV